MADVPGVLGQVGIDRCHIRFFGKALPHAAEAQRQRDALRRRQCLLDDAGDIAIGTGQGLDAVRVDDGRVERNTTGGDAIVGEGVPAHRVVLHRQADRALVLLQVGVELLAVVVVELDQQPDAGGIQTQGVVGAA